jgi:3-hydroxyisobutyrate dehydrogenase-like beta-hydroxyacid dehydrogenase
MKVGVIGLGIMGSAMSANLMKNGFKVVGFDVDLKARKAARVTAVDSVPQVDAGIIIISLPSAAALHSVCSQIGRRGAVVIETSTLPIKDKIKARNALAKKGITLLDCPLSGTGAQAKVGDLVVFASGSRVSYKKSLPVLRGFSRAQQYVGEFGNGSKMKFVANLMVAIHNVSAGEAFALGIKAGLKPQAIFDVQANSAGTSRMFQVRGPMMVRGRYDDVTMKNEVWQKDMKIIGDYARRLGVATPTFRASAGVYKAAMKQGFARQDTGAVCAVLERMSGIRRR